MSGPAGSRRATHLSPADRKRDYVELVQFVFGATADIYYSCWGEFFHLGIFDRGDDATDFAGALERTHERYFDSVGGAGAARILELACGGGAFSEWMADRTRGEVLGVDLSETQLARAERRVAGRSTPNLRFRQHDIMRLSELDEPPFDAAVCLDAACYLPDKPRALRGIGRRLGPGARFLLVDWCRPAKVTSLQEELILEPFYRYWAIPEMESVERYERAFERAGFRLLETDDLSDRVRPNWERGYRAAQEALASSLSAGRIRQAVGNALRYGPEGVRVLKDQFYAALFARTAADAGLLRYVLFLAERR